MSPTTCDDWLSTLKGRCGELLRPGRALMLTFLILTLAFPLEDIMRERSIARHGPPVVDFLAFYSAGRAAREPGKHHLYDDVMEADQSHMWGGRGGVGTTPFITPPFSAVLMQPLTVLSWMRAYMLWKYATVLMTALAVYLMLLVSSGPRVSMAATAIGVAAAFSFNPFQYTVFLGQLGGVILLAWALGIYLFARGRPVSSAFCLAFGTVVKVAPAIAVPLFVMRRQWRWLGAYFTWVLALTGFSVWRLGWQPHMDWLTRVYPVISCGVKHFYNRSLPGLILWTAPGQKWGLPGALGWEVKALDIILAMAFFLWCWKKSRGPQGLVHELALAPLLYLLISPVSWTHHFILALVPLVYLWMKSQGARLGATVGEIAVLAVASLVFGVAAPTYLAGGLNNSILYLFVIGLWVLATVALLCVGMSMYKRCIAHGENGLGKDE
jgi:alpha-1,2-mannosyltransferase